MTVEALPDLIVSFKRQVYLDLLAEFGGLTRVAALLGEPIVRTMMAADGVSESEFHKLLHIGELAPVRDERKVLS